MKNEQSKFLSNRGYKGTRDFYPRDMKLREYLYDRLRHVMNLYGYEEYGGPIVEHLELYASKTSEEIVNEQLYTFTDRGDRKIAIRPEMTPTLARMVSACHQKTPKPMRWFSIPTCMRYERPQRGRLREFEQLNVDIFGGDPFEEDCEILLTAVQILRSLGASEGQFLIKLNHREIVNSFLESSLNKKNSDENSEILRLLDKRDKLSEEEFFAQAVKIGLQNDQIKSIENFLNASLDVLPSFFDENNPVQSVISELNKRITFVNKISCGDFVKYDPTIMRGFDYYTGVIFEVFDTHLENRRALFGGGRYDNLVGAFSGDTLSGIGYGVSDVSLYNFMEKHDLLPVIKVSWDICVVRFSDEDRIAQWELAEFLRQNQFSVLTTLNRGKFGKQIQAAEKLGAQAVAFRGEDELKNQTFCLKFLKTGEQKSFEMNPSGIHDLWDFLFAQVKETEEN